MLPSSQLTTVESLWAIRMEVRPRVAESRARMMLLSVIESSEDVASSNTEKLSRVTNELRHHASLKCHFYTGPILILSECLSRVNVNN